MAAQTFPELGILGVRRGGHAKRSTRFDVCSGSGLKTSHQGGTRYRCGTCGRTLRVTCLGNLPVHMKSVQTRKERSA